MFGTPERRAIAVDLFTGGASLVVAAEMFWTFSVTDASWSARAPNAWLVAVATAVVTGGLFAAADRSRRGLYALVGVGVLAIFAILYVVVAADHLFSFAPWFFIGIGTAVLLNRLVFGVIRPLPEARKRRI